jgi:hypothetical protein
MKMETKHTLGQWRVQLTTEKQHLSGIDYLDIVCGNERICAMDSTLPRKETEANARLIAAAPDMLEALEAVIGELRPYHVDYQMSGPISELVTKCKAAIAKAKAGAV